MRVIKNLKNLLQTILWFLVIFGGFTVLVLVFIRNSPTEPWEWKIRVVAKSPVPLNEVQDFYDPDKPDPRFKEYRHARFPKQTSRN